MESINDKNIYILTMGSLEDHIGGCERVVWAVAFYHRWVLVQPFVGGLNVYMHSKII